MHKTPDKIKKGLSSCNSDECNGDHADCPYLDNVLCIREICGDALAYIQQLEKELAQERAIKKSTLSMDADGVSWCIEKGWISVEERLPPVGTAVLVRVQSKRKTWQCIMTDMWVDGKWLENADSDWHIITHWMPLPEPPEV